MSNPAPPLLLNMMGVWASLTGLLGVLANGAAICLFCRSNKVGHTLCKVIANRNVFCNSNNLTLKEEMS